MKRYLIGIDIGTSGTKAAIFDTEGHLNAEAYEESRLYYPYIGAVEQNPDEIFYSALDTIKDCMEKSRINPSMVEGISIDGQMAGICGIDKQWNAAIPYDSWLDTRCSPYIKILKKIEDDIIKISGGPPTFSHGAKMLWWMNERPDVFKKIAYFIMPSAYVAGKMAGLKSNSAFIDNTYIHFSCFADILNDKWSDELIEYFNLSSEKLPRIIKPWEIIGKVDKKTALYTGLKEGIPIAAGCGDQTANILGAAINKPGMVFDVAGTASVFSICTNKYVPDIESRTFFTAKTVFDNLWYAIAYINGGGLNIRWFRDEIIKDKNYDCSNLIGKEYMVFDDIASEVSPGSEKLFFIPHMGGRVCPNNPNLKGLFFGLTWRHKKQHFYRAILEAVAYEYAIYMDIQKSLLPGLKIKEARVIGGGSKSNFWNQLKADILGIPFVKLEREEFGVLGSAILAGYASGVFDDMQKVSDKFNKISNEVYPNMKNNKFYKDYINFYKKLLKEEDLLFQHLSNLN
ncbi:MAG: FGGY family carbohydrate kinase [Actinomycetota bacterium]|nr:FGGY family carbohydrate kinase [Actinomycetota bacterium]